MESGSSDPLPSHLRWAWAELVVHVERVAVVPVLTVARTSTNSSPS